MPKLASNTAASSTSRYNIAACVEGDDTFVADRLPGCPPRVMASTKIDQLHALLRLLRSNDGGPWESLETDELDSVMGLAEDLALETKLLIDLATEVEQ
ncbi:hypothetical protein [Ralstonia flatus]|uniref:Uncharacterized protein n=1 Tax=Ralstonia flatus TaxID=3058601 RepID=A0AAD2BXD6_9RALS|nr:hypothetical protein [Ralstonia sp. LMG 32965]CAJ0849567.1 hypothetical protein R77567_00325 [Ralstonia sp. LMG 32965]CAJ0856819.1 hypothetical protein R77564_00413 [Ralstonia sp. LMG 32965]